MLNTTITIALIAVMTTIAQAGTDNLWKAAFEAECTAPYEGLLENQKTAKNYKNLSERSKQQLNESIKQNVEICLDHCKGEKFSYCDNVQRRIEAADKKRIAEHRKWNNEVNGGGFFSSVKKIFN